MVFSSPSIDAVAEAIVAQPEGASISSLYATLDGKPRSLTALERIELFERVLRLRADDPVAAAELATARRETGLEHSSSEM